MQIQADIFFQFNISFFKFKFEIQIDWRKGTQVIPWGVNFSFGISSDRLRILLRILNLVYCNRQTSDSKVDKFLYSEKNRLKNCLK